MKYEDAVQFKITEVFGTVELEQQAVFDCGRIGYKTRTITKDERGNCEARRRVGGTSHVVTPRVGG